MCSNTILQTIDPYNPPEIITHGKEKKWAENLERLQRDPSIFINILFRFVTLEYIRIKYLLYYRKYVCTLILSNISLQLLWYKK